MNHARRSVASALLLGLLACGSTDPALDRKPVLLPPFALDDAIVVIDENAPQAFVIDASKDPLAGNPLLVKLPQGPHLALQRNGYDEGLIVCLGRRADDEHREEPASLVALRPDGQQRVYALGNPFDRLEQSEDGRYALLFKSKTGTLERLLDDLNEIAVVDLEKEPLAEGAVTLRTLRSFGDSPDSVVFSPQMMIAGQDRRLAVVLSGTTVTLLDLDHLDHRETVVQLTVHGDTRVTPNQVVFSPNTPELFVRGSGAGEVFVFNLSPRAGEATTEDGELHNDFRPFIDQLGVGANPSDMALAASAASARLLVLSSGNQASVIETGSSHVTSLKLPKPATHALLFDAPSPRNAESATRALLYADGQSVLTFLDLDDLDATGTRAIDTLQLQHPVKSIVPMLEQSRVLVLHEGQSVSVVDLANRTARPIASPVTLSGALFDAERGRVWVGPAGQPFVAWLDIDTGATHEVRLDAPIDRLLPLFAARRLAIVQQDGLGLVTVLDVQGDEPTRADARSVRGFLAAGLLDRGE